jgi:thiazolinyl imide reductase
MSQPRWKVVVCGTKFGRVYMSALAAADIGMDLAGIVAAGSERSKRCAQQYGVPLYTDVAQLPADIDAACVAVGSGVAGGPGTQIALQLLGRGIHVLQEHPIHHDELATLFRSARKSQCVHLMSTLYPHVRQIHQFLVASEALRARHTPIFIDGACSLQLKVSFLDIVGRALGRLRPWAFEALPPRGGTRAPFRSVQGEIGGVPVSLRFQNQLHAVDPDNHCHLYHQLTVGTAVGSLNLVDTHGPILWRPRPHIPLAIQRGESPETSREAALDLNTMSVLAAADTTWRGAMVDEWPQAVRKALQELRRRAQGEKLFPDAQYYLSLMQMTHEIDRMLGPPEMISEATPTPASVELFAMPEAVE